MTQDLIKLLQYQIQQHLGKPFEVLVHQPLRIDSPGELVPTLTVVERSPTATTLHWVLDLIAEPSVDQPFVAEPFVAEPFVDRPTPDTYLPSADRRQRFAQAAVTDYWAVDLSQVALRTYNRPQGDGYTQCKLLHVGEQASPTALPQIALRLQEPLPLYFLTRTLKGQRTYTRYALPLQIC